MRSMILAAVAALAFVSIASAETYKLDAKGGCHDSHGKYAKATFCKPAKPAPCRDPKTGRFIKCHP